MINISDLFLAYQHQFEKTENAEAIFENSGMVNVSNQLDYGFFPLGSGILTEKSKIQNAEIREGGILILGNDFGTIKYVKEKCKNKGENNSKTISNLQNVGLIIENTFFTNFYLGLRDNENHPEMTMTKLAVRRTQEFKKYCCDFFITQLKMLNPSLVICLGRDVGFALQSMYKDLFSEFGKRNMILSKLYEDMENRRYEVVTSGTVLGDRKFVFIPHPSYAHINWMRNDIEEKIKVVINEHNSSF